MTIASNGVVADVFQLFNSFTILNLSSGGAFDDEEVLEELEDVLDELAGSFAISRSKQSIKVLIPLTTFPLVFARSELSYRFIFSFCFRIFGGI
jgi:hypothetical protein